jgi:hypothetical protein
MEGQIGEEKGQVVCKYLIRLYNILLTQSYKSTWGKPIKMKIDKLL